MKTLTKEQMRAKLTKIGWHFVMTEEDGCETWTNYHELKKTWPESILKKYGGGQCYWDLDKAWETQREVDEARKAEKKKNEPPRLTLTEPTDAASWDFKMGFRYALLQLQKKFKITTKAPRL